MYFIELFTHTIGLERHLLAAYFKQRDIKVTPSGVRGMACCELAWHSRVRGERGEAKVVRSPQHGQLLDYA